MVNASVTPVDALSAYTNDPNPLILAICVIGFLLAAVWNIVAYYKLFTLEHVKREIAIKRELRAQGVSLEDDT